MQHQTCWSQIGVVIGLRMKLCFSTVHSSKNTTKTYYSYNNVHPLSHLATGRASDASLRLVFLAVELQTEVNESLKRNRNSDRRVRWKSITWLLDTEVTTTGGYCPQSLNQSVLCRYGRRRHHNAVPALSAGHPGIYLWSSDRADSVLFSAELTAAASLMAPSRCNWFGQRTSYSSRLYTGHMATMA